MAIAYEFKTKSQTIYTAIREMITNGKYQPDEIFNSVELAKKFGVSRTPVTEAVKMLEAKGFVTVLPGVGFKIRKPSIMEILELLEIRGALELLAIRRAVQLCCKQDIDDLEDILNKIKTD
jgi:DNA-binding GntR family transcriptional regulator